MSSRSDYDFSKEHQAEERKLIDEIRYKRVCIETVSEFLEKEDVQHGIRGFATLRELILSGIVALMTNLPKFEEEDPIFLPIGKQRSAKATWKECLEVDHDAERIRSTSVKLSMAYEVYGFLSCLSNTVISKELLEKMSRVFYWNQATPPILFEKSSGILRPIQTSSAERNRRGKAPRRI
ncbi:unnamed protein product [Haemonchus placei]|uniref:RUN domain-containing protein n=1 Tax=Haemonchus placei TaxID=6290 RepID=A0A0N4W6A9_HAEPC|nr:unnamed protein product [Haemonchus placei]